LGALPGLSLQARARRRGRRSWSSRGKDPSSANELQHGIATSLIRAELLELPVATTGNIVSWRPATSARLVRPPLAAVRVLRGRLTRSPLFPLRIVLPLVWHSPIVAPWLRRGASLCSGGAATSAATGQARGSARFPRQTGLHAPNKPVRQRLPKRLPRKKGKTPWQSTKNPPKGAEAHETRHRCVWFLRREEDFAQ